jgi:hypothetical protein
MFTGTRPSARQEIHARIGLLAPHRALGHEYAKPDDVSRIPRQPVRLLRGSDAVDADPRLQRRHGSSNENGKCPPRQGIGQYDV